MSIVGHVREIWRYPVKSMAGEQLQEAALGPGGIAGDRGWAVRDEQAGEIRGAKQLPKLLLCRARYLNEPTDGSIPDVAITLPDGTEVATADGEASRCLSDFLERPVTLWPLQPAEAADHYRRAEALADETSLREFLSRETGEPLPDLAAMPADLLEEVVEYASPRGTYFDLSPLHLLTTASVEQLSALNADAVVDVRRFRPNLYVESTNGPGFVEIDWCGRRLRIGDLALDCEMPCVRCGMTAAAQPELPKDHSILRTIVREADQNMGVYGTPAGEGRVRVGDAVELAAP